MAAASGKERTQKKCCCSPGAVSNAPPAAKSFGAAGSKSHQHHGAHDGVGSPGNGGNDAVVTRDPVCGMTVNPVTTPHRHNHDGEPYYFCSAGCLNKFTADTTKYLGPAQAKPSAPAPEGTIYTCPMHPQIRQVGPGSCPICGMALEPALVSLDAAPNPELKDMSRRFWIGLVLTVPVVALEMGGHLTNLHMLLGQKTSNWLQFLLATPGCFGEAGPFSCGGGNRSSRAISICSR